MRWPVTRWRWWGRWRDVSSAAELDTGRSVVGHRGGPGLRQRHRRGVPHRPPGRQGSGDLHRGPAGPARAQDLRAWVRRLQGPPRRRPDIRRSSPPPRSPPPTAATPTRPRTCWLRICPPGARRQRRHGRGRARRQRRWRVRWCRQRGERTRRCRGGCGHRKRCRATIGRLRRCRLRRRARCWPGWRMRARGL